jgi:riboflavin transporter FmnP
MTTSTVTRTRMLTGVAMLSAVSVVLSFLSFPVPLMPSFIKLDLAELPALIGAFAYGPLAGAAVCLVKNLVSLMKSSSGGVGTLCNFLLGVCFVVPAGLIYKKNRTRKGALIGSLLGAAIMAVVSIFVNYYVVYPIYTAFMPMEAIIGMYQAILPSVKGLLQCLIIFNMPFTFVKGLLDVVICFLIYKPLSPILHGK